MSYSIAELEKEIGLSSDLEAYCSLCHFKAKHRDSKNKLKEIVETFKGNPICLLCLTMKKICYSEPDGIKLRN